MAENARIQLTHFSIFYIFFYLKHFRKRHYSEFEDVSEVLEKWEICNRKQYTSEMMQLREITSSLEVSMFAIKTKLVQQESTLNSIR